MTLPFSTDQFFGVFAAYNQAIWPVPVVAYLQGLLFFWKGGCRGALVFRFQKDLVGLLGLLFIVYAAVLYPLFGYMLGHTYPHAPMFGVAPCPTTIFTLGLLLWAEPQVPIALLVIPLLWTLIGSIAVLVCGVTEDFGLFVAGVLGTANLAVRQRFGRQIKPS